MSLLQEYRELRDEDVERSDLGAMRLPRSSMQFRELRALLDEMVEIADRGVVPEGLINELGPIVGTHNSFVKKIRDLKHAPDVDLNHQAKTIQDNLDNFYTDCFKNKNGFLSLFSGLRHLSEKDIPGQISQLATLQQAYEDAKTQLDDLLEEAQKKISEQTISDYAAVFERQAASHSQLRKLPPGIAQLYWGAGVLLVIVLVLYLHHWIEPSVAFSNLNLFIPEMLRKLLIISILLFGIRFCFRQFGIHKHLATLNQHRQHTLNSYLLLIKSLSEDDISIRNAVMLEVAKAIYERGQTGFLTENLAGVTSPSIIELTKLIGKNTGGQS